MFQIKIENRVGLISNLGKSVWQQECLRAAKKNWIRTLLIIISIFLIGFVLHWLIALALVLSVVGLIFYSRFLAIESFKKVDFQNQYYFPNGYLLKGNAYGFWEQAPSGQKWEIKRWQHLRSIHLQKEDTFILYNFKRKEYHFFFAAEMQPADYEMFKKFVLSKLDKTL